MGITQDQDWMQVALKLAKTAYTAEEVPIGAIVVFNNEIVGRGYNQSIQTNDPTAHAEILALRAAAKHIGNYRLVDCEVYSTLEPCAMCAGALVTARIKRIIYAASDLRAGACGTILNIVQHSQLNHRLMVTSGILEEQARTLLQTFFQAKR